MPVLAGPFWHPAHDPMPPGPRKRLKDRRSLTDIPYRVKGETPFFVSVRIGHSLFQIRSEHFDIHTLWTGFEVIVTPTQASKALLNIQEIRGFRAYLSIQIQKMESQTLA